jgi:TolB protein
MVLALADRQVRPLAPLGSYNAAPVPGGEEVVFAQRGQGLVVARADGSAPRRLTGDASDKDPTVTRDGKQVVFQRTRGEGIQLYRVPLAGGEARPLTARNGQQPALSPVEDRLVYLELTAAGAVLMVADLDGKSARLAGVPDGDYMHPRFSPDGKRILFVRKRTELVEVAVDGSGGPRVLWKTDSDGIYAADYAPDGDGWVASIATWEGDLWIAEGEFP